MNFEKSINFMYKIKMKLQERRNGREFLPLGTNREDPSCFRIFDIYSRNCYSYRGNNCCRPDKIYRAMTFGFCSLAKHPKNMNTDPERD